MGGMFEILNVEDVTKAIHEALPRVIREQGLKPEDLGPVLTMTAKAVEAMKGSGAGGDPWDGVRRMKASAALIIACSDGAARSMQQNRP